jgi:hypothetical protein
MVRSRVRAQHRGVMEITDLASRLRHFLTQLDSAPYRLGQFLRRSTRGLLQEIAQQGPISHPFFFHGAFLLRKSKQPSFLLYCILSASS